MAMAKADMAGATDVVSHNQWLAFYVAQDMRLTDKQTVALMMALYVESGFHNWSNPRVPASYAYPNDGEAPTGGDLDSVGILQQRVGYDGKGFSKDWGSVDKAMDPEKAMRSFSKKLKNIKETDKSPGQLAQLVQASAYPDRYQDKNNDAGSLVARMKEGCK